MISFTLSIEQLQSAPPEVRQWIVNEIATGLMKLDHPRPQPVPAHEPELAACDPDEAVQMFELIRDDYAATRVFLEFAREASLNQVAPTLHAISIGQMLRYTGLTQSRLLECLTMISSAFQRVRNAPDAALFGFDQANHLYIHDRTHRSISALWDALMGPHATTGDATTKPTLHGFMPPRVGPSEDVAAHRQS